MSTPTDLLKVLTLMLPLACAILTLSAESSKPPVSIRAVYDGTLSPDVEVNTFRHIDRLFPSRVVRHGASVLPLPKSKHHLAGLSLSSGDRTYSLAEYLALNKVSGVLVLKNGAVALEEYRLGNTDASSWVSWSLVKSISSTLLGAAIQDGYVESLDDKVTKYLPQLSGSAYEGVSIRNLLQMASGVNWNETYTDPQSDRRHMLELQIAGRPGSILQFMAKLPRLSPPGTRWNYSTGETHILGALIRAAVKRPLAQYLSEKIWSKVGMESDATWWLESPGGLEVGGSGLSATLRDYGRFAVFVLGNGKASGAQIVPAGWFPDAGAPKLVGGHLVPYGYMWWSFGPDAEAIHQGAFEAVGIFGQFIYLNPRHQAAIVAWSAREKPTGSTVVSDSDFFASVVSALDKQGAIP